MILIGQQIFIQRLKVKLVIYYTNIVIFIEIKKNFHLFFSVYAYPIPEGKSGQQVVDSLQKDIELLGAVKTGSFNVDCETYNSVNLPGNIFYVLQV
jgi:hypothetical protein